MHRPKKKKKKNLQISGPHIEPYPHPCGLAHHEPLAINKKKTPAAAAHLFAVIPRHLERKKARDSKMQAGSVCISAGVFPAKGVGNFSAPKPAGSLMPKTRRAASLSIKAGDDSSAGADPAVAVESVVDYSSLISVFPAEACETIGGEACDAAIYPEAKLTASTDAAKPGAAAEEYEREYLDYNQQKTVFPGEACDDLGGEFCAPEYQIGVCSDTSLVA